MSVSNENLDLISDQNIILYIPLLHIVFTTANFWGWSAGFGANVETFSSWQDVVNFGATDMLKIYAFCAIIIFVNMIYAHKNLIPDPESKNVEIKDRAVHSLIQFAHVNSFISFSFFASFLVISTILIWQGYQVPFILIFAQIVYVVLMIFRVFRVHNSTFYKKNFFKFLAIVLLFYSIFQGLSTGQHERHLNYVSYEAQRFGFCGDKRVIRSMSDNFIAISRDNKHVLINKDCRVLFEFPRPILRVIQ